MKKLAIIITLLAVLMSIVSCGGGAKKGNDVLPEPVVNIDTSKPGWEQDKREVVFDWFIGFPWYSGKWGEDAVTQEITKLTGVDVHFIVPAGNPIEKLNTMIISDSLPDLITIAWVEDTAKQMQDPRFTYNLEKLAEKYDPYFFKVTSEDARNWYRKEDGGVYGYPNVSYVPADYDDPINNVSTDTFMVRKDLYEAIGSPDMTTPEGFLNALKAAQEKFPEIDGQSIIPLGLATFNDGISSLGPYLQNFLAVPDDKDGAIYDRNTDPEYIAWLKTFRKANEMGLISRDLFSDTRQQIEEKITQGRYFALLYPYIDAQNPLTTRYNADPNSTYIAIDGPKNSKGDEHELSGPGISGWTLTFISKNNKDPEKAIRFLSFLFSPKGKEIAFLGPEGLTWEMVDGKPQIFPEIQKLKETNKDKFNKEYGADWQLWMALDNAYQAKHWPTPTPPAYRQQRDWTRGKAKPRFQFENLDPIGNSQLGIKLGRINQKFSETLPKMILAKDDTEFDKLLNDYIEYRKANGFDEVQEYRNQRYLENKTKLGIK